MAVSNGNKTGPVVVAPRRSHEALAVARHVSGDQIYSPWGMLAAIDLHGCERSRLEDPGTLRRFVPSLINAIGMHAHGALAADAPDLSLLLYPAYFCLVNGAIAVLIHHRRSLLGATGWRGFGCGRAGIRSGWA